MSTNEGYKYIRKQKTGLGFCDPKTVPDYDVIETLLVLSLFIYFFFLLPFAILIHKCKIVTVCLCETELILKV